MDENSVIKESFRQELRALLEKYNATISFDVGPCSDTYGLYDDHLKVYHTNPDTHTNEDWIVVDDWYIDKNNI